MLLYEFKSFDCDFDCDNEDTIYYLRRQFVTFQFEELLFNHVRNTLRQRYTRFGVYHKYFLLKSQRDTSFSYYIDNISQNVRLYLQ